MKIIQTYWSQPTRKRILPGETNGRPLGGWPNEKYHAISWALSCLQLTAFYDKVELYTDKEGERWLIDQCGLPYDEVRVELNCLDNFNHLLWAVPKIYTYS